MKNEETLLGRYWFTCKDKMNWSLQDLCNDIDIKEIQSNVQTPNIETYGCPYCI